MNTAYLVVLSGFATTMALIAAIGAQNAFVLRQGIRGEHVLPVVAVCTVSDLVLIVAGIAGFGALITAHPDVVLVARYGGAAFLLGYGLLAARRAVSPGALTAADTAPSRLAGVLATCLALTFLNPHVYLDTVILLGALANEHREGRWLFGAGAVAASAVWFTGLGFGARRLQRFFAAPKTWRVLDGVIAAMMIGLGLSLALS
ncbi:MAG: L-lysine exporter [Actinomycetota bacterium]|nr:L-lysine exporter [Actinomycetota bacterium]